MNIVTDGVLSNVQTPAQRINENEGKLKYFPKRNKRNLHKLVLICDLSVREFKITGHKDVHWNQRTIQKPRENFNIKPENLKVLNRNHSAQVYNI